MDEREAAHHRAVSVQMILCHMFDGESVVRHNLQLADVLIRMVGVVSIFYLLTLFVSLYVAVAVTAPVVDICCDVTVCSLPGSWQRKC